MSLPLPQDKVLLRGDTDTFTLTMPEGAGLTSAEVLFTTRACATDDTAVWAKTEGDGLTVGSDTEATVDITTDDWDAWESAGCPKRMAYDFEVQTSAGTVVRTPVRGTITVVWDVTR